MPTTRPARTALALAGVLALAAGCGDAPAPAAPAQSFTATFTANSAAPPPPSASPVPAAREVVITITKRRASPPASRVEVARGDVIRITVTSDEADELHVHGYDVELPLAAGTPGSITLRADRTGLFEVETHKSKLVLFQLVVR